MSTTYATVMSAHGVELPAHLEAQAQIPLLGGLQRQGDVFVLPGADLPPDDDPPVPIPAAGIAVVRGEATAHTHLLVGDGTWTARRSGADLGVVTVATEAYLLHPEHGANGLAPGRYLLRRQREQAAGGTRMAAD